MLSFPLQRKSQGVVRIWCAFELLQTWVWGSEKQPFHFARSISQCSSEFVNLLGFYPGGLWRVFTWSVDTEKLEWNWQGHGIDARYIWLLAGYKNMSIRWATILTSPVSFPPQTPQVRLKASHRWEGPPSLILPLLWVFSIYDLLDWGRLQPSGLWGLLNKSPAHKFGMNGF